MRIDFVASTLLSTIFALAVVPLAGAGATASANFPAECSGRAIRRVCRRLRVNGGKRRRHE